MPRWQPILEKLQGDPRSCPWQRNPEHARRVVWRNLKDWLESRLAIAATGLTDIHASSQDRAEAFGAGVVNGESGEHGAVPPSNEEEI